MADWLPLVMPRPNLFEHFSFPDLSARDLPEIFECTYERVAPMEGPPVALHGLQARDDTEGSSTARRSMPRGDIDEELAQTAASRKIHTAFLSLPIVASAWVFSGGSPDGAIEPGGKTRSGKLKAICARSFLSWNTGPEDRPLYQLDLMTWLGNVPLPDFSGLPDTTPVQIIVPFERPKLNAHRRITLASRLQEDLYVLGQVYGWGKPHPPRHIDMPRFFA